ncbi:hypothetical protein U1Q18_031612 [Sarracenia purpurea var. burkii]
MGSLVCSALGWRKPWQFDMCRLLALVSSSSLFTLVPPVHEKAMVCFCFPLFEFSPCSSQIPAYLGKVVGVLACRGRADFALGFPCLICSPCKLPLFLRLDPFIRDATDAGGGWDSFIPLDAAAAAVLHWTQLYHYLLCLSCCVFINFYGAAAVLHCLLAMLLCFVSIRYCCATLDAGDDVAAIGSCVTGWSAMVFLLMDSRAEIRPMVFLPCNMVFAYDLR